MVRQRIRKLVGIGDVLMHALSRAGLTDQARRLLLFQCWSKAVGAEIAARTSPEGFSRGVLLVRATSATWQNELTFLKADIITRLNDFVGEALVRDLRVVCGTPPRPMEPAPPPPPPLSAAERQAAHETAAAIASDDVRAQFEATLCADLRRRPR